MTSQDELASLYPFLYSRGGAANEVDGVLAQVRQSTIAKAGEIAELRREVLRADGARLAACAAAMADRFGRGGRLFAFGNGGSSTDAQDLATTFLDPPPPSHPMPAFALTTDIAVVTALSNDIGFDVVFSRQVAAFARTEDIAVGLSTSGNSANLLTAFDEAKRRGMLTVGISGDTGGRMAELSSIDYLFVVPSTSVHRIQEAQTTIYHVLAELSADGVPGGHPIDAGRDAGTVRLGDTEVGRGSRVVLRPRGRSDAQDMFLEGKTGTVHAIRHDIDGTCFLAVTVDGDPAAELLAEDERYRYFATAEVQPLPRGEGS